MKKLSFVVAGLALIMSGPGAEARALPVAADDSAQVIPTVYEAGHFFAVPETADGQRLRLLVDTGGGGTAGMYWISKAAAARLKLTTHDCNLGTFKVAVAPLPAYKATHGLPALGGGSCGAALMVQAIDDTHLDGQLGAPWLSQGVFTFDYPAQRLTLERRDWKPDASLHKTLLGFPHDDDGARQTGYARIGIRVDGQDIDMLLDTGATSMPTAAAIKIAETPTVNGEGVASYISHSIFEGWHKAHPGWRVVEKADDKRAMKPLERIIEVPLVQVAGWTVGPVWFTEQPDAAYHVFMAGMMDKPTEGALGGNVFRHFVMTIDYPHEAAYFRCVQDCSL